MNEPDPFAGIEDDQLNWADPDQPHVVVVVGQEKSKRYANVVGPFNDKAAATNYAARSRHGAKKEGVAADKKLSWHVRPIMPLGSR